MRQGTKGQSRHVYMPMTDLEDRKNMRKKPFFIEKCADSE